MYCLANQCDHIFTSNNFYVYEYWHDGECFYVGKGRDDRWKRHIYYRNNPAIHKTNPHFYSKIKKIVASGKVEIRIVFTTSDESECFSKEVELIKTYDNLTNINRGGEGNTQPGKPVNQYDMFGEYINTYPNAKEAARVNGWSTYGAINACCNLRERSYKGFLWSFVGNSPRLLPHNRVVYQWSLEGKFITKHVNASEAARCVGCDVSNIPAAIRTGNQSQGFIWSHDNTFPGVRLSRKLRAVEHINTGVIYSSVTEASKNTPHTIQSICAVCSGKKKSVGGNVFRYV